MISKYLKSVCCDAPIQDWDVLLLDARLYDCVVCRNVVAYVANEDQETLDSGELPHGDV